MENNYSELRKQGLLCGTIKAAKAKRKRRDKLTEGIDPLAESIYNRLRDCRQLVRLGHDDDYATCKAACKAHPRKKNWEGAAPSITPGIGVHDEDCGQYSRGCTYHRHEYTPIMQSYGFIGRRGVLIYRRLGRLHRIAPAHGYAWGFDSLELHLTRNRDGEKYHVDSNDLINPETNRPRNRRYLPNLLTSAVQSRHLANMRTQQHRDNRELRERRYKTLLAGLIAYAVDNNIGVYWPDTIAAGNCPAGSKTWIDQHDLTGRRWIGAATLNRIGKNNHHVERTLVAAAKRWRRACRRGFEALK